MSATVGDNKAANVNFINQPLSSALAIKEVGKKLVTFFPYQSNDINELPDEISKG